MNVISKSVGIAILVALISHSAWAAKEMSIQVQKVGLRDKPSYLGKPVGYAEYGDRVTVAGKKGDWVEIATPSGSSGWVHESAVTKKHIVLEAGDVDVGTGASDEELALAGKGFNADVEAEFKADNKDADFSWVDSMEGIKYSATELKRFLDTGGLKTSKGGAK